MQFLNSFRTFLTLLSTRDWKELQYKLWLRIKGIDLRLVEVTDLGLSPERSKRHSSSASPELLELFKSFHVSSDDQIIDIGCGKGGALIEWAKCPFSRLTGVDVSPHLIDIARNNFKKLKIDKIDLHCCDAAEFRDLDTYTYIYFYNPFPNNVMKSVMMNVNMSLSRTPRKVTIVYHTPACHQEIVEQGTFFKVREVADVRRHNKIFVYTNSLSGEFGT